MLNTISERIKYAMGQKDLKQAGNDEDNEEVEEFKDRLQLAMDIRNIKPIELSNMIDVPISAISQYMSGYTLPKQDRIRKISKLLKVDSSWLLGYTNMSFEEAEAMYSIKYNKELLGKFIKVCKADDDTRRKIMDMIDILT